MSTAANSTKNTKNYDVASSCLRFAGFLTLGLTAYNVKMAVGEYYAKNMNSFMTTVGMSAVSCISCICIIVASCSCCQSNNILSATRKVTKIKEQLLKEANQLETILISSNTHLTDSKKILEIFTQTLEKLQEKIQQLDDRLTENKIYLQLTNLISEQSNKVRQELEKLQKTANSILQNSLVQNEILEKIERTFSQVLQLDFENPDIEMDIL